MEYCLLYHKRLSYSRIISFAPAYLTVGISKEETEGNAEKSDQSQFRTSDSKNSLGMDWDENWAGRFFRRVMDDKRELQEEKRKLEEQWQYFMQERSNFEDQKRALEAREKKLVEVEDLIPSAKYLKDIGISFDQALVWIDCIQEKAEIERIDLRTATWKLAQDLRLYRELGGLSKAIQDATQQLAMLNMVKEQQKRAIATLVDLQKAGFSEKDINELVGVVTAWNRSGIGVGQANGHGLNKVLDTKLIGTGNLSCAG